jgi:hypothetical protein
VTCCCVQAAEAEAEAKVAASPDGSVAQLEAQSELARLRSKQAAAVAGFMAEYNPVRAPLLT